MSVPACSSQCVPALEQGWVRLPPVPMPMSAGFGTIENRCPTPITIVGVSSPAFADSSLHETSVVDGISRMRPVAELRIPARSSVDLAPGGLHLMLMQPRAPLIAGATVDVEFVLESGATLRGQLKVRKPAQ